VITFGFYLWIASDKLVIKRIPAMMKTNKEEIIPR
jgi:hypothetical protein